MSWSNDLIAALNSGGNEIRSLRVLHVDLVTKRRSLQDGLLK
jgi:hypothetical protein